MKITNESRGEINEVEIEEIVISPRCGSNVSTVAKIALQACVDNKVDVRFSFNDFPFLIKYEEVLGLVLKGWREEISKREGSGLGT